MAHQPSFACKTGQNLTAEMWYWVDKIEIFPPFEHEGQVCILDTRFNQPTPYVTATCDQLRHGTTNYEDELLPAIKATDYPFSWKEAVLNTVKYQATRRAFKAQHEWIVSNATVDKSNIEHLNREIGKLRELAKEAIFETEVYKKLQKGYEQEVARRKQLGESNKSLGRRISGVRSSFRSIFRKADSMSKEDIINKIKEIDQRIASIKCR
ncbi:MAG: hypothetical protein ACFB4I_11915 [Cyanophyceae cyanobacterium]